MTTLNIILLIIIYLLGIPASYNVFKKIRDNGWSQFLFLQLLAWPYVWIILILIAIVEGFKHIWNN